MQQLTISPNFPDFPIVCAVWLDSHVFLPVFATNRVCAWIAAKIPCCQDIVIFFASDPLICYILAFGPCATKKKMPLAGPLCGFRELCHHQALRKKNQDFPRKLCTAMCLPLVIFKKNVKCGVYPLCGAHRVRGASEPPLKDIAGVSKCIQEQYAL